MNGAHRILAGTVLLVFATALPALAQNRLASEPSPYLQLHATDPVDWWPWGEAALAEAQQADKPIFLSIGYLACHWCHVMQKENYENPETAALMNELFVNIMVDREERPDIDALFMQAAEVMELQTGWPLNMFLTPAGRPFYGGVYFPPEEQFGLPGFPEVLRVVAQTYHEDPGELQSYGRNVMAALTAREPVRTRAPSRGELRTAWRQMAVQIDEISGGFGRGTKYPRLPALMSLWRAWLRGGDPGFRDAVSHSVETMANSALYDHLGGGFARYAADPGWRIPHFEKMLDINAQMVSAMTEVWRETRSPLLAARTDATVEFLLREMRMRGGAFGSALDADSEGREGAFYVWTEEEIDRVLGADSPLFKQAYDVTAEGNWEGVNILHRLDATTAELGKAFGLDAGIVEHWLAAARGKLFASRASRERPAFDAKAIADWNGLAIVALAEAGAAFERPGWIAAARRAYGFVRDNLRRSDGRLHHVWRGGAAGAPATAEDYAQLGLAALVLFEVTGETAYLVDSRAYANKAQGHWDPDGGGFLQVVAGADPALPGLKSGFDGQTPSGNAAMAELLARLYFMTGEDDFRQRADATIALFAIDARHWPIDHGAMLSAADTLTSAVQVVIVGGRGDTGVDTLLAEAWRTAIPGRVLQVIAPGTILPDGHPAQYKEQVDGMATAYVCVGTFCSLPQTEAAEFAEAVRYVRRVDRKAATQK